MRTTFIAAAIAAMMIAGPALSENAPAVPAAGDAHRGRIERVVHNPPGEAPSLGPRFAPVTIEFFADLSDYTQTYRAAERIRELAARHPLRLRVVYRLVKRARGEFAEAAVEAFAQGRFHAFLAEFYGRHRKTPPRSELESIAVAAKVDYKAITDAWADNRHAETINGNRWRQRRFGLSRTPAILVNGKPVETIPRNLEGFEALYDAAYSEATVELAAGASSSGLYERLLANRAATLEIPRINVGQVDGPRLSRQLAVRNNGFAVNGDVDYNGPHSEGPRDAPVQIAVYCAIGTRYCNATSTELSNLRSAYGDQLRIVFKPVLAGLEDQQAAISAELLDAADCAAAQELFWPLLKRLRFRMWRSRMRNLETQLAAEAKRAGLDVVKFRACRSENASDSSRLAVAREAREVGVTRVPSLVIGGRLYVGALSFEALSALVEVELAPGLLERWLDN